MPHWKLFIHWRNWRCHVKPTAHLDKRNMTDSLFSASPTLLPDLHSTCESPYIRRTERRGHVQISELLIFHKPSNFPICRSSSNKRIQTTFTYPETDNKEHISNLVNYFYHHGYFMSSHILYDLPLTNSYLMYTKIIFLHPPFDPHNTLNLCQVFKSCSAITQHTLSISNPTTVIWTLLNL